MFLRPNSLLICSIPLNTELARIKSSMLIMSIDHLSLKYLHRPPLRDFIEVFLYDFFTFLFTITAALGSLLVFSSTFLSSEVSSSSVVLGFLQTTA